MKHLYTTTYAKASLLCVLIIGTFYSFDLAATDNISSRDTTDFMIVEKKRHQIPSFTTFNGDVIKDVQIGYESYGELNADKSNAVLITHYFTGSSHAAGKYSADDEEPGYWDEIIGPGKAIDTTQYFVISVDSLVNINAYDEHVITTGPASINPDTGKAYGLSFPVVTMRDFVDVQKAVLEALGIKKLHAVAGPSMGSMQAIEWAATYPKWVPRLISVIGAAQVDAWTSVLLEQWTLPIRLDPNWRGGNYHQHAYSPDSDNYPSEGLTAALALITQSALTPNFFNDTQAQLLAQSDTNLYDIQQSPVIVSWLMQRAQQRSQTMDANHLLYLVRANQLFVTGMQSNLKEGLKNIQAKTLFIPARQDLLLMPYHVEQAASILKAQGKEAQTLYLEGDLGHLEGLTGLMQYSEQIRAFLASD